MPEEDAINISRNIPVDFLQTKVNIVTVSHFYPHKRKVEEIYILPHLICIHIKLVLYVQHTEHKYVY